MWIINSNTRYGALDFFTINCVEECLEILKDDLVDKVVVNIVPYTRAEFLIECGGASHNTRIFNNKFDATRPPKLHEIFSEVNICNDIEKLLGRKLFLKYFKNRFFTFIESFGVEVNEYSMFTMCLLHEFGHCNLMKLFLQLGMEKEYDNLYHLSKAVSYTVSSHVTEKLWNKYYGISLRQTSDLMENNADAYAFKNFPYVWERVKKFIRPELKNKSDLVITRCSEGMKRTKLWLEFKKYHMTHIQGAAQYDQNHEKEYQFKI